MKNKLLALKIGFVLPFIYTIYDDHMVWERHKAEMQEHKRKMAERQEANKRIQFSR